MERVGDWIQTYSGGKFYPHDPRAEEIKIEDIAHALAMTCRFGGHCTRFYSVAEHSVHAARAASEENKLWALLHDASEAYLADIPRPIKPFILGYKNAERVLEVAIAARFGLPIDMPAEVKAIDAALLATEAAQIMTWPPEPWANMASPLDISLPCWSPDRAEGEFLSMFDGLTLSEAA